MDDQGRALGPDDTLRALATRLLAFRFPSMAREDEEESARLLVGELPPDLPLALPVPEGARIFGAFVGGQTIIALETELDADAVLAFYAERMAALGWGEQDPSGGGRGGFVHSFARSSPVMNFSQQEGGPVFTVMAGWAPDGHSTVEITFHPEGNGFVPRQRQRQHRDIMSVFPAIRPPKRAQQTPQGGGGGLDVVHALARLECDLDLAAVASHYRAELERGGWQLTGSDASGPVAWSLWTFHDDEEGADWTAALLILDRPARSSAAQNYVLQLVAERVPEPRTEGAGKSGRVTLASSIHVLSTGGGTTMGPVGRREPEP
jgi:hypothetical protein